MKRRFTLALFAVLLIVGALPTLAQEPTDDPSPFATNTPVGVEETPEATPETTPEPTTIGVIVVEPTMTPVVDSTPVPDDGDDTTIVINDERPAPDTDTDTLIVVGAFTFLAAFAVFGGVMAFLVRLVYKSLPPEAQQPFVDMVNNFATTATDRIETATQRTAITWDDPFAEFIKKTVNDALRDALSHPAPPDMDERETRTFPAPDDTYKPD